jgi:hypothetical protein
MDQITVKTTTNVVHDVFLDAAAAPSIQLSKARGAEADRHWTPGNIENDLSGEEEMDLDDILPSLQIMVGVHLSESASVIFVPKKDLYHLIRGAPIVLSLDNPTPRSGDFMSIALRHTFETVVAEPIKVCVQHQTDGNPTTIEIMHRDEITLNKKDNSLATDIDGDHQKLVFKCLCHSSETHNEGGNPKIRQGWILVAKGCLSGINVTNTFKVQVVNNNKANAKTQSPQEPDEETQSKIEELCTLAKTLTAKEIIFLMDTLKLAKRLNAAG